MYTAHLKQPWVYVPQIYNATFPLATKMFHFKLTFPLIFFKCLRKGCLYCLWEYWGILDLYGFQCSFFSDCNVPYNNSHPPFTE